MKFEYKHETVIGSPDSIVKRLNELGDDGWEVLHLHPVMAESSVLNPATTILLKRPK
jgi:hypothetical protein